MIIHLFLKLAKLTSEQFLYRSATNTRLELILIFISTRCTEKSVIHTDIIARRITGRLITSEQFLLCISAAYAVVRCLFVRPSVCRVCVLCQKEKSHPQTSSTIG